MDSADRRASGPARDYETLSERGNKMEHLEGRLGFVIVPPKEDYGVFDLIILLDRRQGCLVLRGLDIQSAARVAQEILDKAILLGRVP